MPVTVYLAGKCNIILTKRIPESLSKIRKVPFFTLNLSAGKSKFVRHPICDTKTGMHWFTKAARASDFTTYGVGMTLYFQFLKFLSLMFLIMTVISAPAYIFFASGNPARQEASSDLKT
jgi:hypothetical protein